MKLVDVNVRRLVEDRLRLITWFVHKHPDYTGDTQTDILFLAYQCSRCLYGHTKAVQAVMDINELFTEPVSVDYIVQHFKEKNKLYTFRDFTFYEYLHITVDELHEYQEETAFRKVCCSRSETIVGKTIQDLAKAKRNSVIKEMWGKGYTLSVIAKIVNCTPSAVRSVIYPSTPKKDPDYKYKLGTPYAAYDAYTLLFGTNGAEGLSLAFILGIPTGEKGALSKPPLPCKTEDMPDMMTKIYKYREDAHHYITANSFICPKGLKVTASTKCLENLKYLQNVVLVLSVSKAVETDKRRAVIDEFLNCAFAEMQNNKLDLPNVVNYTESGVTLWWHIDPELLVKCAEYKIVANNLCIIFNHLLIKHCAHLSEHIEVKEQLSCNPVSYVTALGTEGECLIIEESGYTLSELRKECTDFVRKIKECGVNG